ETVHVAGGALVTRRDGCTETLPPTLCCTTAGCPSGACPSNGCPPTTTSNACPPTLTSQCPEPTQVCPETRNCPV
ncbi:MAG TPA: hypothetical protein VJ724_01015, partial [Tahibacter sp.]|nr:hypothetical protein [Tahibacter sp.]